MYRGEISLTTFKFIGALPPESSQETFTPYNVYSIFIFLLTYAFTFSTFVYLFEKNLDMEDLTESLFYTLALLVACIKMAIIFLNRNKITEITEALLNKQYEFRNFEELCIQQKFDKMGRTGTIIFIVSVIITVTVKLIVPLTKGVKTSLPYKAWIPYSLENNILFWLTFILQGLGSMIAGQATVAGDTFVVVMMLQLCAQNEILIERIKKIPQLCNKDCSNNLHKEQLILGSWIEHHNSLYFFRNKLNDVYNIIFSSQIFATTIGVCTSTYVLTTLSITSVKFWSMIFSLGCVMFQICLYCWHGSLVTEKSKAVSDAVLYTDWILLSNRSKKSLLFIMKRSTKPIIFTANFIAPLSIETFTAILRLSYSIYNSLIQSQ